MKKRLRIWLIAIVVLGTMIFAVGCGKDASQPKSSESSEQISVEEPEVQSQYDVDLAQLSGTMVYGQVFDMLAAPDDYRGKTVKMEGVYGEYLDEETGIMYYACLIEDATACCSQGIEFIPEGLSYPDDFPEVGEEIVVAGTFDTYNEGEAMYVTLRDAAFLDA